MLCKVRDTIERNAMLSPGASVLAAVSGGPDSMTLLDILLALKDEYSLNISAAHINHCIRGGEADRDERFVAEYCERRRVRLYVKKTDIPHLCRLTGESVEQCARRVRYEFFAAIGGIDIIATAHTLNDSCETTVFNMARGTGTAGLCGIPARRGNIIRPLIDCKRSEVEAYCQERGIAFVEDTSNRDTVYTRNKIRLAVMPVLQSINPAFLEAHQRSRDILSAENDYMDREAAAMAEQAKRAGGYDAVLLEGLHPALRRRTLALIVRHAGGNPPEYAQIERVESILAQGGKTQLGGGLKVRCARGLLDFPGRAPNPWGFSIAVGDYCVPSGTLTLTYCAHPGGKKPMRLDSDVLEYVLDADKITGGLSAGSRKAGDKILFSGNHITKSLKKLFNEKMIAPEKRGIISVISDNGGPVCVEGFGVAGRCACTEQTRNTIRLTFRRTIDES